MSLMQLTGLEVMQRMVAGTLPYPSMAETVPMRAREAVLGRVVFEVQADERHLNPLGGVHGGFSATVLDSVTGCAVHSQLPAGVGYCTTDLTVKMVRPVPRGTPLLAQGQVLSQTRSLAVAEGSLKDAEGKIYALATATCQILKPESPQ
ncbi:PaaI family thioesterase [Ferrimonas balearica]|uniref:PaaI family thioesterase n=1 Tax=Ferrimonas balearica TaxID=44012 RepID=UPI001C98F763|nr:PaaI family thioesterase [Ferrimonas balearica]MBY5992414.1 PaaI family thioesterase [Ferrimonas balearica]